MKALLLAGALLISSAHAAPTAGQYTGLITITYRSPLTTLPVEDTESIEAEVSPDGSFQIWAPVRTIDVLAGSFRPNEFSNASGSIAPGSFWLVEYNHHGTIIKHHATVTEERGTLTITHDDLPIGAPLFTLPSKTFRYILFKKAATSTEHWKWAVEGYPLK